MKGNAHGEPGRLQPPPIAAIPPKLRQTKSHLRGTTTPRDVKNEDRPGYVYENKGGNDKMSGEKHGFYTKMHELHSN
jgi:hypothetical protein